MKLRIHSDLHLEFEYAERRLTNECVPPLPDDADTVLVLAGDIMSNYRAHIRKHPHLDEYTPWIRDKINRFKAVIYVLGNHDYWNAGHWQDVVAYWKGMSTRFSNFHVLANDHVVVDGVRFLGTTLWTDLSNPIYAMQADGMNDFNYIKVNRGGGRWSKWNIGDWNQEHQKAIGFFEEELAKEWTGKTVVVSHHAPTVQSISDRFAGKAINCCYYTNLERFMWYNDITLWCHGHIHNSVDLVIGDEIQSTRVICNPRGYFGEELNPEYDPTKLVEI